jgi:hypothetical protein
VGKAATSAFTRVFDALWRRAHVLAPRKNAWARRLRALAHPTTACMSSPDRELLPTRLIVAAACLRPELAKLFALLAL